MRTPPLRLRLVDPAIWGGWIMWARATIGFFLFVLAAIGCMGLLMAWRPGGPPRRGVLGIETPRGDCLFSDSLGSACIFPARA